MPSSNAARLNAVARRIAPWLVGPTVLILRGRSFELADPGACPGLLELLSIAALRSRPELPVGQLLDVLQAIVMAAALAAFAELVCRRTRSLAIALAAAMAVGLSPLFPLVLAPPWEAAAFGISSAAALLTVSRADRPSAARSPIGIALLVTSAAALLIAPLFVLAGPLSATSPVACLAPTVSPGRAIDIVTTLDWWLGPFGLGLAAVGAFAELGRADRRGSMLLAVFAIVASVIASGTMISRVVAAAPLLVVVWWLAAQGLDSLVHAMGRRLPARIAGAVLVVLLPVLASSRRVNEERDDWIRPRGHDAQTLRQMTTVLNLVPQEAAFVAEDATVDVLLRAAVFGGRRKAKPITIVDPNSDAVAAALAAHAVYAFPRRQDDLALRGFVVDPAATTARLAAESSRDLEGLAQITGRRSCQSAGRTFADFASASDRIALSADSDAARGPVVIYLGGASAGSPYPDGWSPRMRRGFGYFTFDQLTPAGTQRLLAEARAVGLPPTHPLLAEMFVIRFNLHRTPRAPLALPVVLGAPFPVGVVKLDDRAIDAGRLAVCDAPPITVSALPQR